MKREFDGKRALHHAEAISSPRLVDTPGETDARQFIRTTLERLGYSVTVRPFRFWPHFPMFFVKALVLFCMALLALLVLAEPAAPAASAAGALAVGALVVWGARKYADYAARIDRDPTSDLPLLRKIFPSVAQRLESANVEAWRTEENRDDDVDFRLTFMAHYDSKSQNLRLSVRVISVALMYAAVAGLVIRLGLDLLVPSLALSGPARAVTWILFAVALAASAGVVALRTANRSPGALDNAGSVGVLLHLAEVLSENPPLDGLRIRFVFTGAEELGLAGAYFHVRDLPSGGAASSSGLHVNLDGVGGGGRLFATMETGLFSGNAGRFPQAIERVRRAASAAGMEIKTLGHVVGGAADHFPLAQKKIPAVTLGQYSRKSWRIHTSQDVPELLDSNELESVGRLLLELIDASTADGEGTHSR